MKKYIFITFCLFIFALFFLFANRSLDPDFGWHLRMGELILKSGISATDPFSYSMSYYPFVDHEWLTNIAIAVLYPKIGLYGLSFICALIAFTALFIQTIYTKKKYVVFSFLLSGAALATYLGIRPQVLSWFFVSVLLLLFLNARLWQKLRFFVPFLMLFWTNLHASFALGIVLLGIFVLTRQIKKIFQPKADRPMAETTDWIIFITSFAATFINPYTWRSWWEVWMQMSDSSLHWSIQEWLPAFSFFNVGLLFLLPVSLLFIFRFRYRFKLHELVLYFILLLFGLTSVRHLPFWLLIAIPMTAKAIEYFALEIKKIPFSTQRFKLFSYLYTFVFIAIFMFDILLNHNSFRNKQFAVYPENAVKFLQTHQSKGNIFNHYNFGGYLIWKIPEKKVFVDGRMPSWRQESAPVGFSKNAFSEYQAVMDGKSDLKSFLAKYEIDTVLLYSKKEKYFPDWLEGMVERVLGAKFPNEDLLKKQLEKEGMKVVYKDNKAVIYRK